MVSYDELLSRIAQERGLFRSVGTATKRQMRDRIRQLENGEIEWQKCQAQLYGPRIGEARLIEGVEEFFRLCHQRHVKLYIVSHKTEFSQFVAGTNLRTAALQWMIANGFFQSTRFGMAPQDVFFEGTRQDKVDRIARLGCTDFIDDLEETFLEKNFPPQTARILYEPGRESPAPPGVLWMTSWRKISEHFFGTC